MAMLPAQEVANLLLGALALASLGIYVSVMHFSVVPAERDFYCTDGSINYTSQYLEGKETVPMSMAASLGLAIILLAVVTLEAARSVLKQARPPTSSQADAQYASCLCCCCGGSACARSAVCIARVLLLAALGILVTEVFTVTLKKTLGRHRPYFLSACHLGAAARAACMAGVRTPVSMCSRDRPDEKKHLLEAIQSFPSGHSSHSMYMTVFAALYLQSRFTFASGHAAKWLLQCLCLLWGCYVCASRIADYRHHWSDVLGGGLLGTAVGLIVCLYLRPSYVTSCVGTDQQVSVDPEGQGHQSQGHATGACCCESDGS